MEIIEVSLEGVEWQVKGGIGSDREWEGHDGTVFTFLHLSKQLKGSNKIT